MAVSIFNAYIIITPFQIDQTIAGNPTTAVELLIINTKLWSNNWSISPPCVTKTLP